VLAATAVLGPSGYKKLALGMSYEQAVATGMLAQGKDAAPPEGACDVYRLAEGHGAIMDVTISGARGIVSFRASGAPTAEGIVAGAPVEQLRATYPDLTAESGGYSATAGGGRYHFATKGDTVTEVRLDAGDPGC
jgi:hypothetical protein